MGYLSCRADSSVSVATCRSISVSSTTRRAHDDPLGGNESEGPAGGALDRDPHRVRRFTYRELESATLNFSERALLGRGSHGAVYKAVLRGGRPVAVKRPSRRHHGNRSEVENEIDILSRIHCPRLVNLIGFAAGDEHPRRERLLVVEFMPNGTLYELLHSSPRPPGWARRLRLALQTAKALRALHSALPPVIHRDVKSANVLLDARLDARLGDFGLALRERDDSATLRSTPPAGTLGYLDPGYVTPDHLSTKTDVFSFGILLLEIISGRKAIDVAHSPPSVVEWAVPLLKKGKVVALYDPRIPPPRDPAPRRQLAALALSCVRSSKERRPTMAEVVEQLKALSRRVPARAWNGLTVGNPCSVVDTEGTLSKLSLDRLRSDTNSRPLARSLSVEEQSVSEEEKPVDLLKKLTPHMKAVRPLRDVRRVFSDAGTRSSVNLVDLFDGSDGEVTVGNGTEGIRVRGSQGAILSKARTLRVERNDYCNADRMLRLPRNRTVRAVPLGTLSTLDGLENLEREIRDCKGLPL